MSLDKDDADQASELYDTITDAMEQLDRIFKRAKKLTYDRWYSYPKGNIMISLTDDHDYLGGSPITLKELVNDLHDEVNGVTEDEDDEDEV